MNPTVMVPFKLYHKGKKEYRRFRAASFPQLLEQMKAFHYQGIMFYIDNEGDMIRLGNHKSEWEEMVHLYTEYGAKRVLLVMDRPPYVEELQSIPTKTQSSQAIPLKTPGMHQSCQTNNQRHSAPLQQHDGLVPCRFCGRKFKADRLERHEAICGRQCKVRPVFNSRKQRGGMKPSSHPKVVNHWKEGHKNLHKIIAEYHKQRKQPQQKDCGKRMPCKHCGRLFSPNRLKVHEKACVKARPCKHPFESWKQRNVSQSLNPYYIVKDFKAPKSQWRSAHREFQRVVKKNKKAIRQVQNGIQNTPSIMVGGRIEDTPQFRKVLQNVENKIRARLTQELTRELVRDLIGDQQPKRQQQVIVQKEPVFIYPDETKQHGMHQCKYCHRSFGNLQSLEKHQKVCQHVFSQTKKPKQQPRFAPPKYEWRSKRQELLKAIRQKRIQPPQYSSCVVNENGQQRHQKPNGAWKKKRALFRKALRAAKKRRNRVR